LASFDLRTPDRLLSSRNGIIQRDSSVEFSGLEFAIEAFREVPYPQGRRSCLAPVLGSEERVTMQGNIVVLVALCAALNLVVGTIVYLLKLPIYLDMIGTILCAMAIQHDRRLAFMAAGAAGVASFLLGGLVNPFLPWFSGTVVSVAALTAFVSNRWSHALRSRSIGSAGFWIPVVSLGVLTGLVAALVSAPIVVYLFGGVTGSGSAALVAFFLKMGNQLMKAAIFSGLTAEPVDKTVQLLLSVLLLRATPESFLARFTSERTPGAPA
jgi:energy-coupling factor transport system substrate-specific component